MIAPRSLSGSADEILNVRRIPARLDSAQSARLLGFQPHDVPVLTATKLLVPLGKPAPNGTKFFAAVDVLGCAENREWLDRATRMINKHWQMKNSRPKPGTESQEAAAA
jgi:hypothetical protein